MKTAYQIAQEVLNDYLPVGESMAGWSRYEVARLLTVAIHADRADKRERGDGDGDARRD